MKNLVLLLTFVFSTSALASSVIAQKEFYAGFSPNPVQSIISILDDGSATAELRYLHATKVENYDLATLSPTTLKGLQKRISEIVPEPLKDWEADKPKCLDAPSKSYKVVKADGLEVPFYQWHSCHEFVLPTADNHWKANAIKTTLDGLEALIEYRFY